MKLAEGGSWIGVETAEEEKSGVWGQQRRKGRGGGGARGGWVGRGHDGPLLYEGVEGEVGDEVGGGEDLHGGGTSVVAGVEPRLDAGPIIGDAGAERDGRFHDVQRDWASEEARHR